MAGKSLGTLTLDLVAKIGGFVDGLSKAERESKKRMDGIKKSVSGVGTAIAALGAGAAVGTAALVKSQIDLADAYSKQSAIVGIAIDDWSALNYATDLSGVSNQQLETSITKLNKAMAGALEGVGAGADAFKILGINVRNADGSLRDSYSVFNEVADAFSGIEDGAAKAALAQDIFGKSGTKLIPLLNGGSAGLADMRREAEQLGQVINADTGKAAEAFNDNLTRLQKVISGTGNELAKELLPSLEEFTSLIQDEETQTSIKALVKAIADIAIVMTKLVSGTIGATKEIAEFFAIANNGVDTSQLKDINKEIDQIADLLNDRLGTMITSPLLPTRLAFANRDELLSELKRLMAARDAILDAPDEPEISAGGGVSQDKAARTEQINKEIELQKQKIELQKKQEEADKAAIDAQQRITDAYSSQAQEFAKQIALTDEATEAEKVRFEIAHGGLKGITDEQAKQLIQMAEVVDANNEIAESAEAVQKRQKEYADLVADLRTDEEKLTDQVRERLKLLDSMPVSGAERSDVVSRIADAATTEAPTYEGLAPEIGGDFGELMKLGDAQKELDEWYSTQLSMLDKFRAERAEHTEEWDAEERAIKEQHEAELQRIETARNMLALTSAEGMFGSLAEIARVAAGENSKTYKAMFALEKAAAIARSAVAIQTGIAMAAAVPWPANLAAMASVAASTASIIGNIQSIGMAHDGIDSVPKTGTWLLEKGERVTTERTSAKLDRTLDEIRAGRNTSGPGVQIGQMVFPSVKNERDATQAGGAAARQISRTVAAGRRYS